MSLNKIRNAGAIFFEVISILIIAFYSSPHFLNSHQLTKNPHSFFQNGSDNPIVYYKTSENLGFTDSLSRLQAADQIHWDAGFDVPALNASTNKALFVVSSLRNVFYVFVSINAP